MVAKCFILNSNIRFQDRSNLDRKLEENRIKIKEEISRREKIKSVTTKINSQVNLNF